MSKEIRKIRQCPHCKSKRGFEIEIILKGFHTKQCSFQGKVLNEDRHPTDDISKDAQCLDCRKNIDAEKLDLRNV